MPSPAPPLPAILAIPWQEFAEETNPRLKLWHLCEAYELLVRFGVMAGLAELRALPEGEKRLDAVLADVGAAIEGPTLAQWLGILGLLAKQIDRGDPLVLPEWRELVAELQRLSPEKMPGEKGCDNSLLILRNTLVHGGAITTPLAQELLDGKDGREGWSQRLGAVIDRFTTLADAPLCWYENGVANRVNSDGTLGEPLPLPADLRATLSACKLDRRVLLIRGSRCLDLWPLCDYGPATMTGWGAPRTSARPAPQVYYRAEKKRLLYAALGCEVPIHQGDQLKAFRAFFKLDRKADPLKPFRLDFAEEIAAEASALRGREAQLSQLKERVKATASGVLWLYGPGGIGKSYLVAKLAHNWANSNEFLTLFWRFRAGDSDRCSRNAFFRHAISVLGDPKHGLAPSPVFPSLDPSQLLKQFLDLLRAADRLKGKKLLFVFDGIDEIARSDADFVRSLFDWRSANAIWLCAGRHEGEVVPAVFALEECHMFKGGLPGMASEEIRELIHHRIGPRIRELLGHDEDCGEEVRNVLVEAIAQRAAGLPLYVHFVCEDILAGQIALDGTLSARLPESLAKYYDDMLRRRGIGDIDTLKTPLVVTVAWAMAPLEPEALLDLLQRRRALPRDRAKAGRILHDGLESLQSMLRPVSLAGGGIGYEPYHLTFRDHIRANENVSGETDSARELFCECVLDWSKWPVGSAARKYLLRHGSEHLLRERRWTELESLAGDDAFLNAQRVELAAEPEAVLRTLRHALVGAGEQDSGLAMAGAVLRVADRHERVRRGSPLDLYRAGNLDGAMALADLQDPQRRVLWQLLLAYLLYHRGDSDGVVRVFRRLLQTPTPILPFELGRVATGLMAAVAPAVFPAWTEQSVALLCDEALEKLAAELVATHGKSQVAGSGVSERTRSEGEWPHLWEVASQIANSIRYDYRRARVLLAVALARVSSGDAAGACRTASMIGDVRYRAGALCRVAEAQASLGDVSGANDTFVQASRAAGAIENRYGRAADLLTVALARVSSGDAAGACWTAELINDAQERAQTLRQVAESQAATGEDASGTFALASRAAETIEHDFTRARALREVAESQAATGGDASATYALASRAAEAVADGKNRAEALLAIARAQGPSVAPPTRRTLHRSRLLDPVEGFPRGAEGKATPVEDASGAVARVLRTTGANATTVTRCAALFEIAAAQAARKNATGAAATLELAYRTLKVNGHFPQSQLLCDAALSQASSGSLAGALHTATTIKDARTRAAVLREIASAQARARAVLDVHRTFQLARAAAESIDDDAGRVAALEEIQSAENWTQEDRFFDNIDQLIAMVDRSERSRRGPDSRFREAVQRTGTFRSESEKAWGYQIIAVAQIRDGLFSDALITAGRILVKLEDHLAKTAVAIVEARAIPAFKSYLLLAGGDIRTAIHACGQLAILYPAEAGAIAELLASWDRQANPPEQ